MCHKKINYFYKKKQKKGYKTLIRHHQQQYNMIE